MNERIILAPGVNGNELLKSLAMHGVNCFNLRICSAAELARIALMRSGIQITEVFVSIREEAAIVAQAVEGVEYFYNPSSPTYSDIQKIAVAIRKIRSLIPEGDEAGEIERILNLGEFKEKNAALISVCKKYLNHISAKKLLDTTTLIRKAIVEAGELDAEFYSLTDFALSPIERRLLDKLSGGKNAVISLQQLFAAAEKPIRIAGYKNCYGANNEVESILSDIYAGKTIDQCTVAVTDSGTYGQLFYDQAILHNIPMTFGCGIPISNSNPGKLLDRYHHWMTDGFFGHDAVKNMLSSSIFDWSKIEDKIKEKGDQLNKGCLYKILGDIKYGTDGEDNKKRLTSFIHAIREEERIADENNDRETEKIKQKIACIPYLEVFSEIFALPVENFIKEYSRIRRGSKTEAEALVMKLDLAAASAIFDELGIIHSADIEQDITDVVGNILKMNVASGSAEAGKLYIADIDQALISVRSNLYIAGLSASKYPGSPKEDYLLLDSDLLCFEWADYLTADSRVEIKKNKLLSLVSLASALDSEINVSYAGLNVAELKNDNPSSLIFELYSKEHKNANLKEFQEARKDIGYFDPLISSTREIGSAYDQDDIRIETLRSVSVRVLLESASDKEYSPSAIETFFQCNRRFMLKFILGIAEPEDDKVFEVISANDFGTMAHSLMEILGNSYQNGETSISKEDFMEIAEEYFDRYISIHNPVIKEKVTDERDAFLKMIRNAYHLEPHRKIVLKEEKSLCEHESGVKLIGYPDRVEELEDGTCIIVDFKTGRKITHKDNDITTCLQVLIYAYMMENRENDKLKISGGQYRYLRNGQNVNCKYDDAMKDELNKKLVEFKSHLDTGNFPISEYAIKRGKDDPDPCKYCKYGLICGKLQEGESYDE